MLSSERDANTIHAPAGRPRNSSRDAKWVRLSRRAVTVALLVLGLTLLIAGVALAAVGSDFSQCANNHGNPPTLGNCVWINGIVQASNSMYFEGMSNPQRLLFDGITSGTTHTIQFSHQSTKGGIHAYDFITSWPQAQQLHSDILGQPLTMNQCANLATAWATRCNNLHSSGFFVDIAVPDDPFVSKDGSTQSRINAFEAAYGNRTMRLWATSPFVGTPVATLSHTVADGGDTGDSDVFITFTYETTAVSEAVVLEFAGHLAVSGSTPVGWGSGLGAGFISGGPFHIKDVSFDGTGGSQDNQIQSPPNPTAVTLTSLTAHPNFGWLPFALVISGVFILASLGVVFGRRR